MSMYLAQKEKIPVAGKEICFLSALFHDVFKEEENHEVKGGAFAGKILKSLTYKPEVIEKVAVSIADHNNNEKILLTIEAKILWDADKLDKVGATAFLRRIDERNLKRRLENDKIIFLYLDFSKEIYRKRTEKKEQEIAEYAFSEYFKDVSKELREQILKHVADKNINLAIEVLRTYFNLIPASLRNDIITQSLNTNDKGVQEIIVWVLRENFDKFDANFRNEVLSKICEYPSDEVVKIIRENFSNIPQQILYKAFLQLSEADDKSNRDKVMEILDLYDKSTCIDEKMKEDVLRKYVMKSGSDVDAEILEKFLERGILNQELRQDIIHLIGYGKT
ncbi:MAG: hypothetical protein CVT88_10475 [Candidatus Altiarchaeales archaeon HGW-Altiarchaeales-1]|nr:MAG: hypothetical protein CVT88_10475 [Candidatus Altiarchaeales archaeon HGW-Altiarchaeales-1]